MLFNSLNFAIFLPIVFLIYWIISNNNLKVQNVILLVTSYFFYSCWDWRFLFLLFFSTFLDYFSGIKIRDAKKTASKKFWFWLSLTLNLGFLVYFKYYNFFIESFVKFLSGLGLEVEVWSLKIILPVGISFYTFHGLSYVIDIYKEKIKPERNFINYSVFVSFFPLLVAGPIERATHLLPQINTAKNFNYYNVISGLRQILWGLFKKIVIADQCAEIANLIFNNSSQYSGLMLFVGAVFFSFQIYGDFSGYSDIALGTARLFGLELIQNFSYPYFSRDIAEFWRRWHISLSTWFRDYLYIPLGGSHGSYFKKIRNTFIIFIVSGFWHGSNWTFISWGILHAIFFLPLLVKNKNRKNIEVVANAKNYPNLKELFQMLLTFSLVSFAWIFFRAKDLNHALNYVENLLSGLLSKTGIHQTIDLISKQDVIILNLFLIFFILIEWKGRKSKFALEKFILSWNKTFRISFYYFLLFAIFWFSGKEQEFIYFQF
jgi:alginate O-acetyltransferase complex protein AlgI